MWADAGNILLGLACLLLGTDSLANGLAGMWVRRQPLAQSAALVAAASAAVFPILALVLAAVLMSERDLALGGIIGGGLAQPGLLLALAAMVAPLLARMDALNWINPILLVAVVLVIALGYDGTLSTFDGGILLAAGFVAVALVTRVASRGRVPGQENADAPRVFGWPILLTRLLIGAALLGLGAWRLILGGSGLASALTINPMIFGLLIAGPASVLAGAPTAVLAARRGRGELALGQALFGASANLLLVLGALALYQPVAISPSLIRFELPALFALAMAVYPMMRSDGELSRREGWILLASYVLIIAVELWLTSS